MSGPSALHCRTGPTRFCCLACGVLLNPRRECREVFAEKATRGFIRNSTLLVEQFVDAADIGLGLLQDRHIEEHHRLPQVVVGAKATDSMPAATKLYP